MLQCDVRDICDELHTIEQRLAGYCRDFVELVNQSPCLALSYIERIAHDRARILHLALLSRGLSTDYERWAKASMDEADAPDRFRPVFAPQVALCAPGRIWL